MIWRAIPVENPVITALETKLITAPSRSSPSTTMTSPASTVTVAMFPASPGSSPAPDSTLCEVSAMAEVSVVAISTVRAKNELRIVGTTPA